MKTAFDKGFIDQQVRSYRSEMDLPHAWGLYTKGGANSENLLSKRLTFESNWIALRSIGLGDDEIQKVEPILARRQRMLYMKSRVIRGRPKDRDGEVFVRDHVEDRKEVQARLAAGASIHPDASQVMQADLHTLVKSSQDLNPKVVEWGLAFNYDNLRMAVGDRYDLLSQAQQYAFKQLEQVTRDRIGRTRRTGK